MPGHQGVDKRRAVSADRFKHGEQHALCENTVGGVGEVFGGDADEGEGSQVGGWFDGCDGLCLSVVGTASAIGWGEGAGEVAECAGVENVAGSGDPAAVLELCDELQGQDAVAAKFQEVIVFTDASGIGVQQDGHFLGKRLELRRYRRGGFRCRFRMGCLFGARCFNLVGCLGQGVQHHQQGGGAVGLAVGCDRQAGDLHNALRNKVPRQLGCQLVANVGEACCGQGSLGGHDSGGENVAIAANPRTWDVNHAGAVHAGVGTQRGFNFRRLDAQSTDFHLVVHAAEAQELAVGPEYRQVAGAVHARAGWKPQVIGGRDKHGSGSARHGRVSHGEFVARQPQFAHHADGSGLQGAVQHHGRDMRVGHTNGDRAAGGVGCDEAVDGVDGDFRWTVEVDQAMPRAPPFRQVCRQWLGTGEDLHVLGNGTGVTEESQHGGGGGEVRGTVPAHGLREGRTNAFHVVGDIQMPAGTERGNDLQQSHVKGHGGNGHQTRTEGRVVRVGAAGGAQQVEDQTGQAGHGPLIHQHAFRASRCP